MSDMGVAVSGLTKAAMNEGLKQITENTRNNISNALYAWLAFSANKKVIPDLTANLERMREKIAVMASEMELSVDGNELVISARSLESEIVIDQLSRGSEWFEPHPGLGRVVMDQVMAK